MMKWLGLALFLGVAPTAAFGQSYESVKANLDWSRDQAGDCSRVTVCLRPTDFYGGKVFIRGRSHARTALAAAKAARLAGENDWAVALAISTQAHNQGVMDDLKRVPNFVLRWIDEELPTSIVADRGFCLQIGWTLRFPVC